MAKTFKTAQSLINSGFNQISGQTLSLSGCTFIGDSATFKYNTNQHSRYTARSVVDASYVTGITTNICHIGSNKQVIFRDVVGITGATNFTYDKALSGVTVPNLTISIPPITDTGATWALIWDDITGQVKKAPYSSGGTTGGTGGITWVGNTVNGIGTYINSCRICSQSGLTFNGTTLSVNGNICASSCVCSPLICGISCITSPTFVENGVCLANKYLTTGATAVCAITAGNALCLGGQLPSYYASSASAITGATNLGSGNGTIYTSISSNKIQLKSLSGGTNVNITCDANYIAINTTKNCISAYSAITTGVTLSTGSSYVILADSTGGAFTITLPATPINGEAFKIKNTACGLINNITVCGNGKNIDGFACALINTNCGALELMYDGSIWSVLSFVN
jgi:hypothetical protein